MNELQEYKEANIELDYYAVLVPKDTASTGTLYGTYNGVEFRYLYASVADFNLTKIGKSLNQEDLSKWVAGTFAFVISFVCQEVGIWYTALSAASGGNVIYSTGSAFHYIFQLYDVRTRAIFTYDTGTKKTAIVDQRALSNLTAVFVPLGNNQVTVEDVWKTRTATTAHFNNKNRNLQRAYQNHVHKSCEHWSISQEVLSEFWR